MATGRRAAVRPALQHRAACGVWDTCGEQAQCLGSVCCACGALATESTIPGQPLRLWFLTQGQLLWRGPRVRMGMFEGQPVSVAPHPASGRADYFGPVCNRSSPTLTLHERGLVAVMQSLFAVCQAAACWCSAAVTWVSELRSVAGALPAQGCLGHAQGWAAGVHA